MSRTKQEVRDWLNSQVGRTVPDLSDPGLNGQCVALLKGLMSFLGVANPYDARGNARDAGDNYIAQKIGSAGRGWLTVAVNRDMGLIRGVRYGHIWVDLLNESNYEQNGNAALKVTKDTRPTSQAQQFINFDQWINQGENDMVTKDDVNILRILHGASGWDFTKTHSGEYDAIFLGAWLGQPLRNVIWAQWNNNGAFMKDAQDAYNAQSGLKAKIAELELLPKEVIVEKPVEVIKEVIKEIPVEKTVYVDKIKEVVKGDTDRSFGDLLSAAFKKLLNIK